MNQGGKGDKPRPFSIPLEQFDNNWDQIFGKKPKPPEDYQDILSTEDCVLDALKDDNESQTS